MIVITPPLLSAARYYIVDCGPVSGGDNSNSGNNVIPYIVAVTVSLLLVALAVVCAIIIRVWKKGPLFR